MRRLTTLLAVLVVAACSGVSGLNGAWVLMQGELNGAEIIPPPPRPGDMTTGAIRPVTLVIDGAGAAGRGPCNHYGGPIELATRRDAHGGVEYGVAFELFADLAGCPVAKAEPVEAAFFEALTRAENAVREGDALTLTGDGVRLVFAAEEDSDRPEPTPGRVASNAHAKKARPLPRRGSRPRCLWRWRRLRWRPHRRSVAPRVGHRERRGDPLGGRASDHPGVRC